MKILVAIKQVATLDEDFTFTASGTDVDPDYLQYDINEWDNFSLEEALLFKERHGDTEVVALTVGPESADEELRKCLAKGADRAIRVWDSTMYGADAIAVGRVLAAVVEKEDPNLVLAGVQASDHAAAATGMATAAYLGWPHAAVVSKLNVLPGATSATVQRELEGGIYADLEVNLPAVMTIQLGINVPRYASLRGIKQAAARPIELVLPSELGLTPDKIGVAGSAARIRRMYVPEKNRAEMIIGTPAQQAARIVEIIKDVRGS